MNRNINVLVTIPFPDRLKNILSAVSSRLQITVRKARSEDDIPTDLWRQTDVLYSGGILPTPEQAPNLKWVQFHFAGIDKMHDDNICCLIGMTYVPDNAFHGPDLFLIRSAIAGVIYRRLFK